MFVRNTTVAMECDDWVSAILSVPTVTWLVFFLCDVLLNVINH